jgi:hypothetical protein
MLSTLYEIGIVPTFTVVGVLTLLDMAMLAKT